MIIICFLPNAHTIEQVNELFIVLAHDLRQHKRHKMVPEEGTIEDVEINSRKLQWVANKKHCNSSERIALVLAHLV